MLFTAPLFTQYIHLPEHDTFSELYLLGPEHTLENIPFDVKTGVNYSFYLGIGNFLGSSNYYTYIVKLGNSSGPLPNTVIGTSSALQKLYENNLFVINGKTEELPLTFKINKIDFNGDESKISSITINGYEVNPNIKSTLDSNRGGYYYILLIELWVFNPELGLSEFHNRYVHLILNINP